MKILVISGFLGAGKTTFIKALAEKTDKRFVVMENEYGEVGIDGGFLASGTGQAEMKVWELTEGCICCTMKADFASSILTISNTLDPEYLVVEPTGLGKLGNILTNISQIQYERIVLLQPVTVLDVSAFDRDKEKYPEICRDQIENAATVIFTKTGALDAEELCRIASEVRAMNPQGEIVTDSCEKKEASWWNGLFERYLTKEGEENAKKRERETLQPDLENAGFTSIHLESGNQLLLFLQEWCQACSAISGGPRGIFRQAAHGSDSMWWTGITVLPAMKAAGIPVPYLSGKGFTGENWRRCFARKRRI